MCDSWHPVSRGSNRIIDHRQTVELLFTEHRAIQDCDLTVVNDHEQFVFIVTMMSCYTTDSAPSPHAAPARFLLLTAFVHFDIRETLGGG